MRNMHKASDGEERVMFETTSKGAGLPVMGQAPKDYGLSLVSLCYFWSSLSRSESS